MRIDRGQYTVPIWWGLVFSGVYVLATPTILPSLTSAEENTLAAALLLSATVCLTGTRIPDTRTAYQLERIGLGGIVLVLGVLAVATDLSVWQQFTLGGGLGALVQIGSIRMFVNLTRALGRSNASSSAGQSRGIPGERRLDVGAYGRAGRQ